MLSISLMLLLAATPEALAKNAVRGDASAIRALRAMGQPGVDALLAVRTNAREFDAAIDAVCRQRDCAWSGLYWHTDLEAAKRAARATKRPILSLRLLGNLDEELSCANSRYFRTLLYPNREISAYLRANYVLHWQSVRSAPVITIDFGNGRTMQRTITGNSIHYVLDADGKPLDAIPGLYAPPVFLALLQEGVGLDREVAKVPDTYRRSQALAAYHSNALSAEKRRSIAPTASANDFAKTREKRLAAWTSGSLAATKGEVEATMLDKIAFGARAQGAMQDLATLLSGVVAGPSTIDDNAKALIAAKRALSPDPSMRSEKSLDEALERLEVSLAADTKINEEKLHASLHQWFRSEEVGTVEELDARVYAELFLAPKGDPWMGLVNDSIITGLTAEGLSVRPQGPAAQAAARTADPSAAARTPARR